MHASRQPRVWITSYCGGPEVEMAMALLIQTVSGDALEWLAGCWRRRRVVGRRHCTLPARRRCRARIETFSMEALSPPNSAPLPIILARLAGTPGHTPANPPARPDMSPPAATEPPRYLHRSNGDFGEDNARLRRRRCRRRACCPGGGGVRRVGTICERYNSIFE